MDTIQRFAGRTIVVTGASSGIGDGIARRFSEEGANVVVAARRRDRLDALVNRLGAERTLAVTADVTKQEDLDAAVDAAVQRFGGIDALISNAGIGFLKPFEEMTFEEWRFILSTNLDSCFLGAKAALPHLVKSGGSIVHIASASGLGGDRRMTAYNAAKGAVVNFTRGLALELGASRVRVNAVAPALTLSDEQVASGDFQEFIDRFDPRRALSGVSSPADVAAAVSFLVSDDARFITGAVLPVDGGVTAASGQPDLF